MAITIIVGGCCPATTHPGTCSTEDAGLPPYLAPPPSPDAGRADALPDVAADGRPLGPLLQLAISAGPECGRRATGVVQCWAGAAPEGRFVDLSAGGDTACGVRSDGTLHCWSDEGTSDLADLAPSGTFVAVSVEGSAACALDSAGSASCWGNAPFPPLAPLTSVMAGRLLACGLQSDASALCWDDEGGFGVPGPWTTLALSDHGDGVGIHEDGTIGWIGDRLVPLTLPEGPTYVDVDIAEPAACAVDTGGEVWCTDAGPEPVARVWVRAGEVCGLLVDGTATCWEL